MHTSQTHVGQRAPSTLLARIVGPIFALETWSATWFLVSTLFIGVWWFTVVALLAVFGFATLILAIGIPVLVAAIAVARNAADAERRRVPDIGVEIPAATRNSRPPEGGWARLRSDVADPVTPRSVGCVLLLLVLGPIWFSLTVTAWSVPLSLLATPLMVAAGFHPTASSEAGGWEIVIDDMTQASLIAALGVVLLPLAPRIIGRMARTHTGLILRLLGPDHGEVER